MKKSVYAPWVAVALPDVERISSELGPRAPAAIMVWLALLRLANQQRQLTLRLRISLIAHHAALGYKAAHGALHRLADLGLIGIVQHGAQRPDEASSYTLRATVPPYVSMTDGPVRPEAPDGPTDMNQINHPEVGPLPRAAPARAGQSASFVPPTAEDTRRYAASIGMQASDADAFCDHFTSNGWRVGGRSPMRDWKAAMRNWQRRAPRMERHPASAIPPPAVTSERALAAYHCQLNGEGAQ